MSLMLIQPDYNGSSPYPVYIVTKGTIRQNNIRLVIDCDKGAAVRNPEKEMRQISRINYLARCALPMICMTMMIMLFTIGFGISYLFQAVRGSAYKKRRYSPHRHLKNSVGLGSDYAGPGSTYPNKSGQNIFFLPCLKNS